MAATKSPFSHRNIRCFIFFRLFFNARFYYPVFAILFLDYGLSIEQFALLNSVWAATIVVAEVPSGALADLIGRKQLLVTTSVLMILEMLLLSFVPLENITLVFWAFLLNRVLSGLAEAMASGADEALAYDTLKKLGNEEQWPKVLSVTMRTNSLGSLITMSLGALIYDPDIVNKILAMIGSPMVLDQQTTMRFPIYLTLILGILSLGTVLLMKEAQETTEQPEASTNHVKNVIRALKLTLQAGGWILRTPFALVIILFAMAYDHVLRMVITMTSQFFRLISLPEASFGIIGAGMSLIGLFVPKIAEKMVARYTPVQNMLWLSLITMIALVGLSAFIPYLGLIPMAFVSAGLMLTAFFTSHYLNKITESDQRATVLSFKGLAFNLAYGLIGVGFAALIAGMRGITTMANPEFSEAVIENISFKNATIWFIPYTVVMLFGAILLAKYLLRNTNIHQKRG